MISIINSHSNKTGGNRMFLKSASQNIYIFNKIMNVSLSRMDECVYIDMSMTSVFKLLHNIISN